MAAITFQVAGLWRYPVKTLAGEPLAEAVLNENGIVGDRLVRVCGPEGTRTARRHHRLLGLRGTLGEDATPLIDGYAWHSREALALIRDAAGDDAWLERAEPEDRFDVLPLLVATDGAVDAFGRDIRRLRPNILVGGVPGAQEPSWPGAVVRIGEDIILHLQSLRGRCVMTTVDPDTLDRDPEVLRDIVRRFGGRLALNASVLQGGTIRLGDSVTLAIARIAAGEHAGA